MGGYKIIDYDGLVRLSAGSICKSIFHTTYTVGLITSSLFLLLHGLRNTDLVSLCVEDLAQVVAK